MSSFIPLLLRVTRTAALTLVVVWVAADARGAGSTSASQAPAPAPGAWHLSWSDEFDGPDGSAPDASKWVYDLGGNGWGNNELETYTDRRENVVLRGGSLVITARRETFRGADGTERPYTSGRLKTFGTFTQTYGKVEARIRIPRGHGIWPAFWMLGDNFATAGWPASGEIDIMENIGKEPTIVHGTIHGPGHAGAQAIGAAFTKPGGGAFADDFHVYAVEWEPNVIRWYVDGTLYQTRTPSDLPAGARWVYDHPFFILVNLAVGGNWPGYPDATSTFPQELVVDYVRVYARR